MKLTRALPGNKIPLYAKLSLLLLGFYVFTNMLFLAQDIILPVIYAIIIAILISPAVKFLEKRKINRNIAIAGILIVTLLIISAVILVILSQASVLSETWPWLTMKFQELLHQAVVWIADYFDISERKINLWIADSKSDMVNNSGALIGNTITTMSGVLSTALLTPVYIFMILFYQPHLVEFIHQLFGASNNDQVTEILSETKSIIQSYLLGLFAEFAIVAVLNTVGLLLLGIKYAILLGLIGAILNVIPYLGGIIGVVLFMIVAALTKSPEYVLYVIVLYTLIQLIDNNYIVPKIVGSKVKLNALVSIFIVIVGAALWGIPGMFLSIPLTAILKLIFDRIDGLKPWGYLLGDTLPPMINLDLREISKKLPSFRKK